jgi:cobalamin synthase
VRDRRALLIRIGLLACVATAIVVPFDLHALASDSFNGSRMAVAAMFLIGAWAWLSRQRTALAFWLPESKPVRGTGHPVLGHYRDWSTLIWIVAYLLLRMAVLGLAD